jgi:hypothetical protein
MVGGLKGFMTRSSDGFGPRPTGLRMPPAPPAAVKVVAWKLEVGLSGSFISSCFSLASSEGVVGRVGELEKQAYALFDEPASVFTKFGRDEMTPFRGL